MAAPLLVALSGAGTALNAYSIWKQGQDKASALLQSAEIAEAKSQEIIRRNDINNDLIFSDAQKFMGDQIARAAASGGGVGSSMALYEETASLAAKQIRRNSEIAEWEARMTMFEAQSMRRSADQTKKGATILAIGTFAEGLAKAWDAKPGGYKSPKNVAPPSYGGGAPAELDVSFGD